MSAANLPGKATHFRAPGKPTACGRNGVSFATEDRSKVDCAQCRRALKATTAATTLATMRAALERIDVKAEAGLCQMTHGGARAFLEDIRHIVAAAAPP